mmetsp:Transcript_10015/g.32628  ORF Transcript_10015/g.32628 Transcript_10015/m.32628 type:complete len:205 (+) Transcript_10015:1835-2449(+)
MSTSPPWSSRAHASSCSSSATRSSGDFVESSRALSTSTSDARDSTFSSASRFPRLTRSASACTRATSLSNRDDRSPVSADDRSDDAASASSRRPSSAFSASTSAFSASTLAFSASTLAAFCSTTSIFSLALVFVSAIFSLALDTAWSYASTRRLSVATLASNSAINASFAAINASFSARIFSAAASASDATSVCWVCSVVSAFS